MPHRAFLILVCVAFCVVSAGSQASFQEPIEPYSIGGRAFAQLYTCKDADTNQNMECRHLGEDVHAPDGVGTPVRAIADGIVIRSRTHGEPGSYGQYVVIAHSSPTFVSVYGHLACGLPADNYGDPPCPLQRQHDYPMVPEGVHVVQGQIIGYIGSKTENGGLDPHLHFAIYNRAHDRYRYWGHAPNPTGDDVDLDDQGSVVGGFFTKPSAFLASPPPPNISPTAAFTMSVPGNTAFNGQQLDISLPYGSTSVSVTLASPLCSPPTASVLGCSKDPDGTIGSPRLWNVTGVASQPQPVTPVNVTLGVGTHQVTLTVTDNHGATGTATGTIVVATPTAPVLDALITLSGVTGAAEDWSVRSSGASVFALWSEAASSSSPFVVKFRRSTDSGTTWLPPLQLSVASPARFGQLAVSDSRVYAAWVTNALTAPTTTFSRSTSGGASFSLPVNISAFGTFSSLAADGNLVVLAGSGAGGAPTIVRSIDAGSTFQPAQVLGPSALAPSVAVVGNDVYVAWSDFNVVKVRHSSNGGVSFDSAVALAASQANGLQSIVVSQATVAIGGWAGSPIGQNAVLNTFALLSVNGANAFDPVYNLSSSGRTAAITPSIGIAGSTVHAAWLERLGATAYNVIYRRSQLGSSVFGAAANLSQYPDSGVTGATAVALVTGSGRVAVIWQSADVSARFSSDAGETFGPVMQVFAGSAGPPDVVAGNGNLYVVFRTSVGGTQLLFRRATGL